MDAGKPVRVILKVSGKSDDVDELSEGDNSSNFPYIYDGLYLVTDLIEEMSNNGKLVFKFTLKRMSNQAPSCVVPRDLGLDNKSKGSSAQKEEIRRNDLSDGKEKFAIRVMAPRDCAELPPQFDYIVNNVVYSGRFNFNLMQPPNPNDSRVQFQLAIFKTERKQEDVDFMANWLVLCRRLFTSSFGYPGLTYKLSEVLNLLLKKV